MNNIKFISRIISEFPLLLTSNILLILAVNFAELASLFSLVAVIDLFVKNGTQAMSPITKYAFAAMNFLGLPSSLGWLLALFVIFNAFKAVFQIAARYSILRTKYAVMRKLILGTFDDFFAARWYFFTSHKQGLIINTFIREMNSVADAFGAMAIYFSTILQVILYLAVPFYLSWQITSLSIVMAVVFLVPFLLLGKLSYRLGKANTSTANNISSVIQESLVLAKVILGFGNQDKASKHLEQVFDEHRRATLKSQTLTYAIPLAYYPFGLLVLIFGLLFSQKMTLPFAETVVLFYSLARVIPLVGSLTEEKTRLNNLLPAYEQMDSLRKQAMDLKQHSGAREFRGFGEAITTRALSFAYPGHKSVLNNVTVGIPKGKMVAFVGESGSGKSTFIDMLMGFHPPASGGIFFDGVPFEEFDIKTYRQRVGYVPQDSILFNLSVRDNLRWALPSASDAQIAQALRQANAEEFIAGLSEGLDTLVGDRGVRLSGGQIQRIALARAILRKPELLILDEATSALDTYSERMIQQAIEKIAKVTTVVVVAHRLSTIVNADYIYVLKEGKVFEEGTYEKLMRSDGQFSNMAHLQALKVSHQKENVL